MAVAGASVVGCASSTPGAQTPQTEAGLSVEITHEPCDLDAKGAVKDDINNDNRADVVRLFRDKVEVCNAVDLNFDGLIDVFSYFDEAGKLRRRETDFDRDGKIDEIAIFEAGVLKEKHRETNLDGKLDTWDVYKAGHLERRFRDASGDGKIDEWWTFPNRNRPECPVVDVDETGDGKPNMRYVRCEEETEQAPADGGGRPSSTTPTAPTTPSSAPAAPTTPAAPPTTPSNAPAAPTTPAAPAAPKGKGSSTGSVPLPRQVVGWLAGAVSRLS